MQDDLGFLREVDASTRQEYIKQFFRNFGRYIVTFTAIIVIATVGYVVWQENLTKQREDATLLLYQAIDLVQAGDSYRAREAFETIAQTDDASIAILANMWLVKLKDIAGKPEEAASMAKSLHEQYRGDDTIFPYTDWLTLYAPVSDTEAYAGSAYALVNKERRAIAHIEKQELAEAVSLYQEIARDTNTLPSMRERANTLLSTYLQHVTKPDAVPAQQPSAASETDS